MHPNFQSALADFILSTVRNWKNNGSGSMLTDVTKAIGLSAWTPDKPLLFILKVYFPAIRKVFYQPVTSHMSPSHNFVHYFSLCMRNK